MKRVVMFAALSFVLSSLGFAADVPQARNARTGDDAQYSRRVTGRAGQSLEIRYVDAAAAEVARREAAMTVDETRSLAPPDAPAPAGARVKPRYRFQLFPVPLDGFNFASAPAINTDEIVFVTDPLYPATPAATENLFSTSRGYLTTYVSDFSFAWDVDINQSGEAVYKYFFFPEHGWSVVSTTRGLIADNAAGDCAQPSISNAGEVVYQVDSLLQDRSEIVSTTRGILVTGPRFGLGQVLTPHVNSAGEVAYGEIGSGIVSTIRGPIAPDPASWPSINDAGEIAYVGGTGPDAPLQLFSSVGGQVTFEDSFKERQLRDATCTSRHGYFQDGVAGQTDIDSSGEIVFTRWLLEGPETDLNNPGECFFLAGLQIGVARPPKH